MQQLEVRTVLVFVSTYVHTVRHISIRMLKLSKRGHMHRIHHVVCVCMCVCVCVCVCACTSALHDM